MKQVIAKLKDKTGYEREYKYKVKNEYADSQYFWWTEGNASCDCNRSRFLYNWDESKMLDCGKTIELLSLWVGVNKEL